MTCRARVDVCVTGLRLTCHQSSLRLMGVLTVMRSPGSPENAENFGGFIAGTAEPVRHLGIEGGDFTRSEHHFLVAEDKTHVPGQDVDPLVTVMGTWFRGGVAGRDDDLPGLHTIGLPGQRDHRPALDPPRLEPQSGIALLGRRDEVVQRHPIGMGERKQQFQGGSSLTGFEAR